MKDETLAALQEVTKQLGQADEQIKAAEKVKKTARDKFMKLATQAILEDRPMRKETISVEITPLERIADQVENFRAKEYPEWKVIEIGHPSANDEGVATVPVTFEEDADLMKFSFINEELLLVFGRTVEERGAFFASEEFYTALEAEYVKVEDEWACNPDDSALEERMSMLEGLLDCVNVATITTYNLDETRAQLLMSVEPETVPVFQQYAHPGKLSAKLTPIRKAKEEEVE